MLWAGFSHGRRTSLVPLFGDSESARGGISSRTIHQLYSQQLPILMDGGGIFMHDNARVHTASIVKALLQAMGLEVMVWPPFSPDLNPIENLWSVMKREIYLRHPELETAADTAYTLSCLVAAAQEAWTSISVDILESLSASMVRRVQAVIDAEGWYTKY